MKTLTASLNVTIKDTSGNRADAELQALLRNAIESALDGIDTTPNTEHIEADVKFVSGDIAESRSFSLESETEL